MASIGDVGFVIHDWIFAEAHLAASLFLPIALDSISNQENSIDQLDNRNKSAKRWLLAYNVVCFLMTIIWFTLSVYSGKFSWRMSYTYVLLFITLILIWSIRSIRKIIAATNKSMKISSNNFLVNIYIFLFVVQLLVTLALQIVSIMGQSVDTTKEY